MKLIEVVLVERIKRTATVESFRFNSSEKMDFLAGQFMQVLFDPANPGNKELNKYLSFSSSPTSPYIEFTKRLSDSVFSERLRQLGVGSKVTLKGPLGGCVLNDDDTKIGFLIGGIGITPVISMLEYIVEKKLPTDVCLVYSNRTEEEIAFRRELDVWAKRDPNIHLVYAVTDCQPKDSTCVFARIDAKLLKERMCDFSERKLFIFGPPRMVDGMKALLVGMGVRDEQIKTEVFVGY